MLSADVQCKILNSVKMSAISNPLLSPQWNTQYSDSALLWGRELRSRLPLAAARLHTPSAAYQPPCPWPPCPLGGSTCCQHAPPSHQSRRLWNQELKLGTRPEELQSPRWICREVFPGGVEGPVDPEAHTDAVSFSRVVVGVDDWSGQRVSR
jgi:hypothetical protein